jgi:hypothetical protein
MSRIVVMLLGLLGDDVLLLAAQAAAPAPMAAEFHITVPGAFIRMQVMHALAGAARRLSARPCNQIFRDFQDGSGQPLQAALDGQHQTAAEYLASLRFVDGENLARCGSHNHAVAFTEPGSHVIYICGRQFQALFVRDSPMSELLIIHELLHSLGLGENPPSSADITGQVSKRCGED